MRGGKVALAKPTRSVTRTAANIGRDMPGHAAVLRSLKWVQSYRGITPVVENCCLIMAAAMSLAGAAWQGDMPHDKTSAVPWLRYQQEAGEVVSLGSSLLVREYCLAER